MAFSHNNREDALQKDRDYYRWQWSNPSFGSTQFFSRYSGFTSGMDPNTFMPNQPDPDVVNTVMGLAPGEGFTEIPSGMNIFVDRNGNVFSGFGPGSEPGAAAAINAGIVDGYTTKLQANGQLGYNNVTNYLILPLERYNLYMRGNYEINDWIGVFTQSYFNKTHTVTIQEPGPIVSGWAVYADPTINRDVIPDGLLTILDSRMRQPSPFEAGYVEDPVTGLSISPYNIPNPDGVFQLNALLPFNRGSVTDVFTYNLIVGLEGKIPQIDWSWEAYVSQGEAKTTVMQTGFASLQRIDAIMNATDPFGAILPNFGQGASITGNQGPPNWGFGACTGTCTSGLNPFDWGSVSDDCWNAILANIKTKQIMEQTIWEANLEGPVVELPAGEMRAAVGGSYRKNKYEFQNDTLVTQGRSFIEQSLGLYGAGNSAGSIEAKEVYGEVLVPVLSDLPFMKNLSLELGGRRSDYDTTGTSYTYKAMADWRTSDWIRLRGGYNRAERAPNIAELYLAPEQTFGASGGGDVCSTANMLAWSANPDTNPDHWRDVVNLCGELMEGTGNPDADYSFYGADYRVVAAADPDDLDTVVTAYQPTGFTWLFPFTRGNTDLKPEKADTWTMGVVIDSPLENEWLSDMRV
jgi:iron complex outermembrane receptor protein